MSYTIEPGRRRPDVVRLQITPGSGAGCERRGLVLPTPVEVSLADLPVVAEPAVFAEAGGEAPPPRLRRRAAWASCVHGRSARRGWAN